MKPVDLVMTFYQQVWGQQRYDLLPEIVDQDCVTHQLRSGAPPQTARRGPVELEHHIREWFVALPDAAMTCELCVDASNLVASRAILSGTHLGSWYGIPATGKKLGFEMMVMHRASRGKIVEDWVLIEAYGAFEQLGLVPPRAELISRASPR